VCACIALIAAHWSRKNAWGAEGRPRHLNHSPDVLKGLKAPVSPDSPWQPPDLREFAGVLRLKREPEADAQKDYELAELIDLAERTILRRKFAWERAKQAASGSDSRRASIFQFSPCEPQPFMCVDLFHLPKRPTKEGFLDVQYQEVTPVAVLEWVLLDFGRRRAAVDAARSNCSRPTLVSMRDTRKSFSRCRALSTDCPRFVGALTLRNRLWTQP